ncbi:MAG: methyltransferase [Oscillibacter sp.]|nr:methyltransferase [Oscillibacter sp.]
MEHWELLKENGLRFVWDDALFRPGTDSFALAAFAPVRAGERVCDLGCGTGLLGLLLLQRQGALRVTGVELDPRAAALADRAAEENALTGRFSVLCADLRESKTLLPAGSFDLVICNPPYYPKGSGGAPHSDAERTARQEETCTLEDCCAAAAHLLRRGGRFCLVHKPERLADVAVALRQYGIELKRLRFVHARASAAPSLLLAEGRRGGRRGVTAEPPLILQKDDGAPTAEANALYFR